MIIKAKDVKEMQERMLPPAIDKEAVAKCHATLYDAAKGIIDAGEEHASLLFGFEAKGGELLPRVMGESPLDNVSKSVLPALMHGIAGRFGVAVHVSEAWTVQRDFKDVKDAKDPLEGVKVSECADKTECVIMVFICRDGWKAFAQHHISTVEGKRVLAEAELVYEGGDHQFGGNLMGGGEGRGVQ